MKPDDRQYETDDRCGPIAATARYACAADRAKFVLVVRAEKGVDGIRALRGALKCLLRRFGLRVIEIREWV